MNLKQSYIIKLTFLLDIKLHWLPCVYIKSNLQVAVYKLSNTIREERKEVVLGTMPGQGNLFTGEGDGTTCAVVNQL